MTTMLIHGWRGADPSQEFYAIVDVADGDAVWPPNAALSPGTHWHHGHTIAAAVPAELKNRVLPRAEFERIAQTRLDLFRALRQLSEVEAERD